MVSPPYSFYVRKVSSFEEPDALTITFISDAPVNLTCVWSRYKFGTIRTPQFLRGTVTHYSISFYIRAHNYLPQIEPGDTLTHTYRITKLRPRTAIFAAVTYYNWWTNKHFWSPPFPFWFQGVDMYVKSLARYGDLEGQILEGDVKLEEGPYITLTRIPEHNSIKITGTAPALIGFYQGLSVYPSVHPTYDVAIVTFDQVTLGLSYAGDNLRIYTPGSISHTFKAPHTMQIAAMRSPDAAGTITAYLALVPALTDLHNALNTPHIAIICRGNKIYASNANGTARTETQIDPVGPYETKWLRWNRTSTGIEFYVDGAIKATHTTNIPGYQSGLRFLYQAIGTYNAPRLFYASAPRITEV